MCSSSVFNEVHPLYCPHRKHSVQHWLCQLGCDLHAVRPPGGNIWLPTRSVTARGALMQNALIRLVSYPEVHSVWAHVILHTLNTRNPQTVGIHVYQVRFRIKMIGKMTFCILKTARTVKHDLGLREAVSILTGFKWHMFFKFASLNICLKNYTSISGKEMLKHPYPSFCK